MLIVLSLKFDLEISAESVDLVNSDLSSVSYGISVDGSSAGKGSDDSELKSSGKSSVSGCAASGITGSGIAALAASGYGSLVLLHINVFSRFLLKTTITFIFFIIFPPVTLHITKQPKG